MKKITTILLLLIFCFSNSSLYSQTKSEPIESGFVFIDGKYIEAPYIVESKDLAVFINGIQITKELEWPIVNKQAFDHDPGNPPDATKYTSFDEAFQMREPSKGILYNAAIQWYLFSHFSYDEAYEMTKEYFENLPFVKSLTIAPQVGWVLESYSGEKRSILFGGSRMRELNRIWGPNGAGPPSKDQLRIRVENRSLRYQTRLQKGDMFLLFPFEDEYSFAERKAVNILIETRDILGSPLTVEQKVAELISIGLISRGNDELCKNFVSHYEESPQLLTRIDALIKKLISIYGQDVIHEIKRDLDLKAIKPKTDSLTNEQSTENRSQSSSFSPGSNFMRAWSGTNYDTDEDGILEFDLLAEIDIIVDNIKDQEYDVIIFKDDAAKDSDPENCSYLNLKAMGHAGILYYASHGHSSLELPSNVGLETVYLETSNQIESWCLNDPLISPMELTDLNWPGGHPWTGIINIDWVQQYWTSELTLRNSITILSSCYSFENGMAAACGGGVTFGYDDICVLSDVKHNNRELIRRMSGDIGQGQFRTAGKAFTKMPKLAKFSMVPVGANITICPATHQLLPDENDNVLKSGTGFFEVDTYCSPIYNACDALTFSTQGEDITISDVKWVGSGKVNTISYKWSGSRYFSVTITVHRNKVRSWGYSSAFFHELDFDKIKPNDEDGTFTFHHDCLPPSNLNASHTSTSAVLNWTENDGADSWEILFSTTPLYPTESTSGSPTGKPYNTSVDPATTYYWYVRSSCGLGHFSSWRSSTFTTEPDEAEFLVEFNDSGEQLGTNNHTSVALGDLDGDGDLDAAVTTDNQNQPNAVWLNDGNANFTNSGLSFGWDESNDVAFGDLDGDSDLDGFVLNNGPNKVYLNDGIYTTDNGQLLGSAESQGVSIADLDGDGDLDAAVANNSSSEANKIWLNDGSGYFTAYYMNFGTDESWDVALGDLDGDSDLDGFVVNDGVNMVYLNDGASTSNNGQSLGAATSKGVKLSDLDDDGDLDALVANADATNSFWTNDGTGLFTDSGFDLGAGQSMCLAIGDLDADDDLDAFIANDGANKVYLDVGINPFDNFQELGTADSRGVALGDLDGDGDLDAFVANYDGPCKVWLNNSDEYLVESIYPPDGSDKPLTPWNLEANISRSGEAPEYLLDNHPDPFTGMTNIKFRVGTTATTTLKVYDSYGKLVNELFNGEARAGEEYTFVFQGEKMPEGFYILYLQSGNQISATEKMVLIK